MERSLRFDLNLHLVQHHVSVLDGLFGKSDLFSKVLGVKQEIICIVFQVGYVLCHVCLPVSISITF